MRHTMVSVTAALHMSGSIKRVLLLLLLVLVKLENVNGARILLTSPQILSHVMMQATIGEQLVKRGHEVYIAVGSRYPKPESLEQLGLQTVTYHIPQDIPFGISDDTASLLQERIFNPDYKKKLAKTPADSVVGVISRDCEFMMSDKKFMELVRALKFDIALVEPFAPNPCVVLLPYNLNIPFVSMTRAYLPWNIRMPALPSFLRIPGIITTDNQPTFLNALTNSMYYLFAHWKVSGIWNNTLLYRYCPQHLTWNDVILKSELVFFIGDHHLDSALPMFPNFISVPGITIRPAKPLPDKLENLTSQFHDGIILITFGSMATDFPDTVIVKFLQAFSRVKQGVIARLRIPEGVAVPANVHVLNWLPQNDILGHKLTKLFITHCGSNSQHEALYHGVPMLGFPLFAEQPSNCERAYEKGVGLTMDIHNFTSEELFDNIQEMIYSTTYSGNIKRSSAIFRDEPLIGPNKAAHWIEHVIKYGSSHLRSPAMDLPLYRFLMLDVLAIIFIIIFVILTITCLSTIVIAKIIWRKLFYKPSQKKLQ